MKKIILMTVLCGMLLVTGCANDDSSNDSGAAGNDASTTDNKDDGKTQSGDDGKTQSGDETTENYSFTDVSTTEFSFSELNPAFQMDDGYIYIMNADGSRSKTVSNWVLSHDYRNILACGFSAQIKVGSQMNYSGLQLFKKDSYDDYEFDVYSDGKFVVKDPQKTVLTLQADASFVKVGEFNKLQVTTADSGNVLVYVNDHLVLTISSQELAFKLTEANKLAVLYNVKSTATSAEPAEAWVKMENIEQQK